MREFPNIEIGVTTEWLDEQRLNSQKGFAYSYTITISNLGDEPAQLISRHWVITDASGAKQEVRGMGVIGEQPTIPPGESHTYTSGVAIATETGSMHGSYQMQTDDGDWFNVEIPMFALVPPHALH